MTSVFLVAGLAVVIYMATQLVKTIVDTAMGYTEVDGKRILKRKADPKKYIWLTRVVFPSIPPTLGLILGSFVPFRPEPLIEYVTTNMSSGWGVVVYAFYGAVVGNFADTIYTKVKAAVVDYRRPAS